MDRGWHAFPDRLKRQDCIRQHRESMSAETSPPLPRASCKHAFAVYSEVDTPSRAIRKSMPPGQRKETVVNLGRLLFLFIFTLGVPSLHAQTAPRDVTVAAPTRLDWAFASQGFGADAGKLPAGYDSAKQRYQLYVPPVAKKPEAWPLVLFISPGDKPAGLSAWKSVCDKEGILFCSPYGAGNSVAAGQRIRIILDVLDDVRRNFNTDSDQTYLSGFSGGGRMACAIGLALPECCGGIAPVCGTNPLPRLAYSRHRAEERLSLAFITGEKDFNRKESEVFMQPWMEDLGIRSKLWIVPKMGHEVPNDKVMAEVYGFLQGDLERRREDRRRFPGLALPEEKDLASQPSRFLEEGLKKVNDPKRTWRGVALLQGISQRWPKTDAADKARARLQEVLKDEAILDRVAAQGDKDEQISLSAQARAFERFGQVPQALQAWQLLAESQPGSPAAEEALKNLRRLKTKSK